MIMMTIDGVGDHGVDDDDVDDADDVDDDDDGGVCLGTLVRLSKDL